MDWQLRYANPRELVTRLGTMAECLYEEAKLSASRCAELGGFSLHADVTAKAHEREKLETICRYVSRPPVATQRLTERAYSHFCTSSATSKSNKWSWAALLKRVFNIDVKTCPNCQGEMRVISAILDKETITKILAQLGLPTEPPPIAPARSPPQQDFAF